MPSFSNGFRGPVNGSVQTAYTDQPGVGVPGMLAFASDNYLADSVIIGEADGIAAGIGVIYGDIAGDVLGSPVPQVEALLPVGAETVADFKGILMFDEAMQSDENGRAGWALQRMGRVMRPVRSGGRIYVRVKAAVDHTADGVHWVTTANATFDAGDFAPVTQAAGAESADISTVAKWVTSAAVGEVAILELL